MRGFFICRIQYGLIAKKHKKTPVAGEDCNGCWIERPAIGRRETGLKPQKTKGEEGVFCDMSLSWVHIIGPDCLTYTTSLPEFFNVLEQYMLKILYDLLL